MLLQTPRERQTHSSLTPRARPCLIPLDHRAVANRSRLGALGWLAPAIALCILSSCDGGGAEGAAPAPRQPATTTGSSTPSAELAELLVLVTPLEEAVTSDITDRNLLRSRELLGRLRAGPRDIGLEALDRLRETPTPEATTDERARPVDVERTLLDIAAHAAPEDTRPLLEALLIQYGAALELRTEAALLLAETAPQRAIELIEPMVTKAHPNRTQPPAEFIVKAWLIACDRTDRSPVPELADVATNLYMDETARILAVKELGRRPEPLALQALQAILIESTGDGYLRRMAAQGLRDSLPKENGCEIFERVASREADLNFALFLADLLAKHCR